jgi:hypothetical protein
VAVESLAVTRRKPTVFLALPRLGDPALESCVSAFVRASEDKLHVTVRPRNCSLLAYGFNNAWCEFLNGGFDYFAMLHADLEARGPWLDTLMNEMGDRFGVMHAAVAIKDEFGLTSTAIGGCMAFDPVRRLTLKELHKLPETFGYEETKSLQPLRHDWGLLPNTGCLLVRRDGFPVRKFTGFSISDMVVQSEDGQFRCYVDPEDWAFGRFCKREGVEVGCTRKIETVHYGRAAFSNIEPWGRYETDENYADYVRNRS